MKTNQIRSKFLEFFKSKEHSIIASDSVVPKDDPTVLFTTAGMQQFKRQFLGHIDGYTRATTSQKCIRTDDLDEVGATDFHHTFFEMLGNFSFGDYFKKEAITWAWEFLTKELNIPAERIWVSVYKDDDEAANIWLKEVGLPKDRLVRLGDKSNFWPSNAKEDGPNGPCGPCSEIFYDYAPDMKSFDETSDPGSDIEGRFSEIWNLVFTQFERREGGELVALPNKNIDTGMGLERLSAVLQGKQNNFQTDGFAPILKKIDEEIDLKEISIERNERYVIADHIRAIVFSINDGVVPSNEGRGYVVKKLIVDSIDIVLRNGGKKPVIYKLVNAVVEAMGDAYPDIAKKEEDIAAIIKHIENAYMKVRQQRMPELLKLAKELIKESKDEQKLSDKLGEISFKYRDTFGLTKPAIEETLKEAGVSEATIKQVINKFEDYMSRQKEQSRASSKMTGDVFTGGDLDISLPKTDFLGYEHAFSTSTLLKIFIDNKRVEEAKKGDKVIVALDKTPFYAESGGQIGDIGTIYSEKGNIEITNTQKIDDVIIHIGHVDEGVIRTDDLMKAEIDVDRRLSIMRNHTATHLLQSALREVLGSHIKQQGSYVAEDRLRFDFTHPKGITQKEIVEIENIVNTFIRSCDHITTEYLPLEKAQESGALAFFAEKYGSTVRVVTIGEYSKEFCGGTHLGSTGQIGLFKITSESAIAQGIRRIEAKSGISALEQTNEQTKQLQEIAKTLKAPVDDILNRVQAQTKRFKQLEKDYETLKFEAIKTALVAGLDDTTELDGISVYKKTFKNIEMSMLRKISDFLKQKLPSSLIILGAKSHDGASILIASSDDAIKKGYKANEMIQHITEKIGGSGGGRPQLAQAGGKNSQKIDEAINQLEDILKKNQN